MSHRIAIVGVGEVGAATAFAILLDSLCDELLLVDTNIDKRDGQVQDLSDAACCRNSSTKVRAASYEEAGCCDIVIVTLGTKHRIGESRLQSNWRNGASLRHAIGSMTPFHPSTVLLVVSNPVDTLTPLAQELSGLPKSQVFGTGTLLSTMRLRALLAEQYDLWPDSIQVDILGENSDNQVVSWSTASVAGTPINDVLQEGKMGLSDLAQTVQWHAQNTIRSKGAIAFGIASAILMVCTSILFDKRERYVVSHSRADMGCCLSAPAVLGKRGIVEMLPITLSDIEMADLTAIAETLKGEQMEWT